MTWTYRVIEGPDAPGEPPMLTVCEVYEGPGGEPEGWCEAGVLGETIEDVRKTLEWMSLALSKPILKVDKDGKFI